MKRLHFILILFIVLFTPNVFATSINSDSYSQANTFSGSSKYDYSTNNLMGDDFSVVSTGSIGTTYSGKAYYLQFNFHHTLAVGKTYDLKISSSTNDFTNQINGNRVVPLCYNTFSTSFNQDECDSINIVSVIRGATSSGQSKDFTIRFTTNSPLYSYWGFKIAGGLYNLTGVSNFRITNIDLKEVDTTGSENIIANAQSNTQSIIDNSQSNTQNIIDNQNQNTQQITDAIQQYMGGPCPNLINVGTINLDKDNHRTQTVSLSDTLSAGTYTLTYDYLSHNSPTTSVQLYINTNSNQTFSVSLGNSGRNTFTIPYSFNRMYFLISSNSATGSTATISNLMLVNGTTGMPYCAFGSTTSKIDETNKAINETNAYLKDDSDPNIQDNDFLSMFNSVGVSDPLNYLLTLPSQLITKIVSLSDTCSTIQLGTLYNVMITLPCINLENILGSSVWNIIDVIFSVSLLVVILKNLYDTFSNLLTMGAEKEAKEKFSMPTPMDFLSMILGGDR